MYTILHIQYYIYNITYTILHYVYIYYNNTHLVTDPKPFNPQRATHGSPATAADCWRSCEWWRGSSGHPLPTCPRTMT